MPISLGEENEMTPQQQTDRPENTGEPETKQPRKSYIAPQMLSVEPLEAVAGNCSESGTLGKSGPCPEPYGS